MSAGTPCVSVLLPVRDAEPTLDACLDSLARQTLVQHEVVAVDDGSRDGSAGRLALAARRDPRLRVVRTPRQGLVAALNRALAEARAPLAARMDADDVASPLRLERQVRRMLADPDTHVLGCRVRLLGAVSRGMRAYAAWSNRLVRHEQIVADLLVESPLAHPSVMLRTEALRALGGYREFDGPEDYDLWLRGHRAGWRFAKLPETLLAWRDSRARLTRRDPRYALDRFEALKLDALERGVLRRARPLVVWGAGPIGKRWATRLLARGHTLAAFVEVDPRKLGRRIHGVPVVTVEESGRYAGALHLAAVGRAGARRRIRGAAAALGLHDGRDLVALA